MCKHGGIRGVSVPSWVLVTMPMARGGETAACTISVREATAGEGGETRSRHISNVGCFRWAEGVKTPLPDNGVRNYRTRLRRVVERFCLSPAFTPPARTQCPLCSVMAGNLGSLGRRARKACIARSSFAKAREEGIQNKNTNISPEIEGFVETQNIYKLRVML